jgi:hypothetical protein
MRIGATMRGFLRVQGLVFIALVWTQHQAGSDVKQERITALSSGIVTAIFTDDFIMILTKNEFRLLIETGLRLFTQTDQTLSNKSAGASPSSETTLDHAVVRLIIGFKRRPCNDSDG